MQSRNENKFSVLWNSFSTYIIRNIQKKLRMMGSFVSARQSCQTNSCSSSSFAVVGIHHRVCIDNIQQGIIQLYIEQKGSMMTWVPDFSQQIPIRQLFWWDLWPTESKGGDKAIITNCLLQTRAPCPEIRDIQSYSFKCNEKSSGALIKPSRNCEFCQPECLKSSRARVTR